MISNVLAKLLSGPIWILSLREQMERIEQTVHSNHRELLQEINEISGQQRLLRADVTALQSSCEDDAP